MDALLLSELHRHLRPGHENARSAKDLASAIGCKTTREIGALVAELVEQGHLIGSTCEGSSHGYFIITTAEDLAIGIRHIKARALSSLHRLSVLERNAAEQLSQFEVQHLFDLAEVN